MLLQLFEVSRWYGFCAYIYLSIEQSDSKAAGFVTIYQKQELTRPHRKKKKFVQKPVFRQVWDPLHPSAAYQLRMLSWFYVCSLVEKFFAYWLEHFLRSAVLQGQRVRKLVSFQ